MADRAKTIGLFVGGGIGVVVAALAIFGIVSGIQSCSAQQKAPHFDLVMETAAGECVATGDHYNIYFAGVAKNGGESEAKAKVTADVFFAGGAKESFFYESGIVMAGGSFTYAIIGIITSIPESYSITISVAHYA